MTAEAPIRKGRRQNAEPAETPTEPCLQIYLVRHGETEWSLSGRHNGATEVRLTEDGQDEARELNRRLQTIPISRIFTSPRLRARRTCYLAMLGRPAEIDTDLAEWDFGSYEGRKPADILAKRADWDIFRDGCPHGETPEQVTDRADRLLARLAELGEVVALFSHDQFSAALAARWLLRPVAEAEQVSIGSVSVSVLTFAPGHPAVPIVDNWNAAPNAVGRGIASPFECVPGADPVATV